MSAPAPERPATDAVADLTAMIKSTRLEELAAHTVEAARLSLLDTIGCAIAGHTADGVAAVQDLILTTGGREQSSVWGTGRSVTAPWIRRRRSRRCKRRRWIWWCWRGS